MLVLDLADVPAPAGTHYEVWVLRQSTGGAMESVGAFTPGGSKVRARARSPGPGDYTAVDVRSSPRRLREPLGVEPRGRAGSSLW